MKWSDDRIEQLRTLWATGLSAGCIAVQIGDVSRCAVLGKVYRLGLAERRTARRVNSLQRNGRRRRASPDTAHPWRRAFREQPKQRPNKRPPAWLRAIEAEDAAIKRVPLLELRPGMCRWPIGDPKREGFGFCGQARLEGVSYCSRHAMVAFRRAERRPPMTPHDLARHCAGANAVPEDD
jgi:GcrA cell cycle regulator